MFTLEEMESSDGLVHQGIVAYPDTAANSVVIFVHGLTGTFYSSPETLRLIAREATKKGMAFGSFNNRGHDMMCGIRKKDASPKGYTHTTIGASYEVFEESIYDIKGQIEFFRKKGYSNIFLAGHSSGANKVCFFAGSKNDSMVAGIILLSPLCDRLVPGTDTKQIEENIQKCEILVSNGREDALVTGVTFFPTTARRYISLVSPHTMEDQFGYGDNPPSMPFYEKITSPMLVVFAGSDEYADRPVTDIKHVFDVKQQSRNYSSILIADAPHNFSESEHTLVSHISRWIDTIQES